MEEIASAAEVHIALLGHNLPESTTSFVGRRRLLAELSANLARTRLLTLTGVGSTMTPPIPLRIIYLDAALVTADAETK
jgi:hypothetical protein